ncbi:MAG: decaheme c-type cytochrome MtrF [Halioglobus sp.]
MRKMALNGLTATLFVLLVACGGGGGGDRAEGVVPGPTPGVPTPPPPPVIPNPDPAPYAQALELLATITEVDLGADNRATVHFQLTDGHGTAITDLEIDNLRFVIARLQASPLGNLTGTWQSYINRIEGAGSVGPGTEDKLQATYEREGEFTNHEDGTYTYRFATALDALPAEILAQAESEGLDLGFEPSRTHRVAIQFDGNEATTANPHYDWVPATGATSGIFTMDIAATANCNNCHDPLAIHGSNRREIEYCVACHNAGSTDANSGNSVDMKVLIHKLHRGASLPSVAAGGEYAIWGFRDSKHDYSTLHYPQDIRNCVNCHAGTATGGDRDDLVLTSQGDNWAEVASAAACGSCHDDAFDHIGGNEETACASCHSEGGFAGSIANSHRNLVREASETYAAEILDVSSTAPGDNPTVTFKISNPMTGEDYAIKSNPAFPPFSVRVGMAWATSDFTNTGNEQDNASNFQADAITDSVDNGDGSYSLTLPLAIPDGSTAPGIAASGSGAITIEGHPTVDVNGDGEVENIPLTNVHRFFSIDEAAGDAVARRNSVELQSCLACHSTLSLHGDNRTDDLTGCATCHNPRNTDKRVREIAMDPPTDGKDEESIDFKTMIHGIHAAAIRENSLEVVGFRGFATHRYNEETVHYPGDLSNCTACHTDSGFTLPLPDGVLGTTIDTGADRADPSDDIVVTPTTAVCASCHDTQIAISHMTSNGGSFSTSQDAIENAEVIEECSVCHGAGRVSDVSVVHNPR